MAFLPALMKRLLDSAPQIVLEVVPMQIDKVSEWLAHGAVDAAIASVPIGGAIRSRVIDQEHYVCVLPDGAGGLAEKMTLSQFTGMRHVVIDPSAGHHLAEAEIAALGIERNIALRLHHFSVLPLVLAGQNLAAIVASRVARMFTEQAPLTIRELPFNVPSFDVSLYWNGTAPRSRALRWFHETVADSLN
jgi:DNA-binding transcriptional LysR family regulator